MTNINCAWVAGLLEGEGCFTASRRKYGIGISVQCNMCDQDVIYSLDACTENIGYITGPRRQCGLGTKPYWHWQVGKKSDVVALCLTLLPHMCSRRANRILDLLIVANHFKSSDIAA